MRAIVACAAATAACQSIDQPPPADDAEALALSTGETALLAASQAAEAPHIYMDLQYDHSGPVSVVFAIDRSKDGTPSDDPAIRLTPEDGKCNPQILRFYDFPPAALEHPVYSQNVALLDGVTLWDLPNLMAVETTAEMMRRGLVSEPQASRPQNVCARKLWTLLVTSEDFEKTEDPPVP